MNKIIDQETAEFLRDKFQELKDDVSINVYYDDSEDELKDFVEFTKNFFTELSEITPKIKVHLKKAKVGDKTEIGLPIRSNPSFTIGEDKGYKILFSGSPLGYEASQVVETIIAVSNNRHEIDEDLANELESMSKEVNVKVFVTPTCPYCPASAFLANRIAIASKGKVTSEVIEANENPEIAMEWGIESVPTQIINDSEDSITIGVQDENSFINQILTFGKN
jgi:glutaredoxin-like protein